MEDIAIVGVAQTKFEREKRDLNYAELVYGVVTELFEKTGATHQDVDNIVTASSDFWDGRTISSMAIQSAVGAYMKSESKVSSDGTLALLYGAMRILSGQFKTTLVVAHSKGSEGAPNLIANAAFDPVYQRQLGIDFHVASALQARAYMQKYGLTEQDVALVSVKNLANAKKNPYAQVAGDFTVDDVMNSGYLAEPIKTLDASPISDGACAVLLAHADVASRFTDKPVWLKGVGHCQDGYYLGDRDLTTSPALAAAARRAYQMASIDDPLKQLDVAEIYDAYSYQELMWTEALGFCQPGEGVQLLKSGVTAINGSLPVNPSGGLLAAHAFLAAGLVRVIECVLQLRGEAGEHQIPHAKTALAHGSFGFCGQTHCVWILSAER
ncbi:MAG: thiolase family protein [Acidobacteriota bacterium]|nr:thiolase family protein [Blastocatellia bacterium]MDW8241327.1 thiolase family protein [Acidobacteriota bacterium]